MLVNESLCNSKTNYSKFGTVHDTIKHVLRIKNMFKNKTCRRTLCTWFIILEH